MDIYWIQNKQRRGPATVPDIISLIQMGEITPDTLGWHVGCPGWVPMHELPALSDFLTNRQVASCDQDNSLTETVSAKANTTPPLRGECHSPTHTSSSIDEERNAPSSAYGETLTPQRVYLPSPSVRLIARLVDSAIYSAIVLVTLYFLDVEFSEYYLPTNSLFWLPIILIEAYCLSRWRTTPGKALMGITIHSFDTGEFGFLRALSRSISVFFLGMGMYIPIVMIIMLPFSYFVLTRKGICLWDARAVTLVTQQQPARPSRTILGIIIIISCLQLTQYCMKPWLPEMIETIEERSPETGQMLRSMLPKDQFPTSRNSATNNNKTPQPL